MKLVFYKPYKFGDDTSMCKKMLGVKKFKPPEKDSYYYMYELFEYYPTWKCIEFELPTRMLWIWYADDNGKTQLEQFLEVGAGTKEEIKAGEERYRITEDIAKQWKEEKE